MYTQIMNIYHRAYLSPLKCSQIGLYTNHHCPKIGAPEADVRHCFEDCPKIRRFWILVWRFAIDFWLDPLLLTPVWAIFGTLPIGHKVGAGDRKMFLAISAARKSILQVWIQQTPPSVKFLREKYYIFRMDWLETV